VPGLSALLITLAAANSSPADEQLLRQAEEKFRAGVAAQARVQEARRHFAEAAELFGELERRGVRSTGLYLNLGNAAYLAGQPARALWAYHSGLRLDQGNRPLRKHRDIVRAGVHYPPGGLARPDADPWFPVAQAPAMLATLGLYAAACVAAALWLRRRSRPLLGILTALALMTLLGLTASVRAWRQSEYDRAQPLVIVVTETGLYRGNGASYPTHPDLPAVGPGVEARLRLRRGAWLQVQFSSGEVGWLPASALLIVGSQAQG
jgi:hypothetical protein